MSEGIKPRNFFERLGYDAAGKWLDNPSRKDPTKSNADVLAEEVLADISRDRPLDKAYLNPIKNAFRKGLIKGAGESLAEATKDFQAGE